MIHHVTNKYTFAEIHYKRCEHDPYTKEESKEKNLIKPGSPVHEMLIKILIQAQLVKDMHILNETISTAGLEVFHSLKMRYLPKSIFFKKDAIMYSFILFPNFLTFSHWKVDF